MICYKDKTFCRFYLMCKNGYNCDRALTPDVKAIAEEWMENAPIAVFADYPDCFVRFFDAS